ncbi:MAG: sensor histidine kinase [Leptolyngbya sp. BL-A-14]
MDLGILVHDGSHIIDSNTIFCQKSGYELAELVGSHPLDLVAPEFREFVQQKIDSASEEAYVTTGISSDGIPVLVEIAPKTITYQGMTLRVAVIREASERGTQTFDANAVRNLVHSLRAPLNNLSLTLQMMRLEQPPEQQRYYELAMRECDREIELINKVLNLARTQASDYEPSFEQVNLSAWLAELCQAFELRMQQQQQQFSFVMPADISPLLTDRFLLRQIVAELLDNASKYTAPGGHIQLQVQQVGQAVELTVANTAQIPGEILDRVYDPFYRYWHSGSVDPGGSGLGLTVIQEMVQLLQGEVSMTSQAGWTMVKVLLPRLDEEGMVARLALN